MRSIVAEIKRRQERANPVPRGGGSKMKLPYILVAATGVGLIAGACYLLVTNMSPQHGWLYGALIAGFIICDRSFWSGRPR